MKILFPTLLMAGLICGQAQNVPELFNYQGVIRNIPDIEMDGEVDMEIKLWDAETEGNVIWGPQVFDGAVGVGHGAKVKLVAGRFNLIIGAEDTQGRALGSAFEGEEVFLGVSVSGNEIGFRQRVLSTPYSLRASFAESAKTAVNAQNAESAQTATSATNATKAQTATEAEGLKASDGNAYGWELLFEGGNPAGGRLSDELSEGIKNEAGVSGLTIMIADLYKQDLLSHRWPLIEEDEFIAYKNRIQVLKGVVGDEVWAGVEYEELRSRLAAEFVANREFTLDYGGILPAENAIQMIWVEPGTFNMGSLPDEKDRSGDEGPVTIVTLTQGFWMAKHEVTQFQWESLMGTSVDQQRASAGRPSLYGTGPQHPMYYISWDEVMSFCERLTNQEREAGRLPDGYEYSLPTEAEWEYTCRAGTTTRFSFGNDLTYLNLKDYGWSSEITETSKPVGTKLPNPWGFYDMHGNVYEWCLEYRSASYSGGELTDPSGATFGSTRVFRGGSWYNFAFDSRSANRNGDTPSTRSESTGFRLALRSTSVQ